MGTCSLCGEEFEPLFKFPWEHLLEELGLPVIHKQICPKCGLRILKDFAGIADQVLEYLVSQQQV